MKTRTVIAYIPGKQSKNVKKQRGIIHWFARSWKVLLLVSLMLIYLIYTNQSSTLGYSLRRSLKDVERAQDVLDDLALEVSKQEQVLWSSVEWAPSKNKAEKIVVQ